MEALYKTSDNYYSGPQRFNILSDRVFRGCIPVFLGFTALQVPVVAAMPPGDRREIFFVLMFLVWMLPAAIVLAGGMPAAGWRWYAGFAAFFAAATALPALGASHFFLLLIVPALLCFAGADRTTPHLLAALGYRARPMPVKEISLALLSAVVLMLYTWLGQKLIRKSGFEIHTVGRYVWLLATSALYYGTLWGIMHGLLMRRFLEMRYQIGFPVVMNIALITLYWIPSVLGYSMVDMKLAIGGSFLQAIASQTALGMSFYLCRSTRPLAAAYVMYYLFLKSINL